MREGAKRTLTCVGELETKPTNGLFGIDGSQECLLLVPCSSIFFFIYKFVTHFLDYFIIIYAFQISIFLMDFTYLFVLHHSPKKNITYDGIELIIASSKINE